MRKLIVVLLTFVCGWVFSSRGQTILKGAFIDSIDRKPIELASVALIDAADSSLISYTVTSKIGAFTLRNIPPGKSLRLIVSHINYQVFRKNIRLGNSEVIDLGTIGLGLRNYAMQELIIKGERPPIITKRDTIEFNVEAFKTRPNAVL